MASKPVVVVINGEEYVSKITQKADDAMEGFTTKIPAWGKMVAGLTIAYQAVSAAIGKVRDVVVESFAAYDNLATSQRKLEGTSKLTGLSMEYLNNIAGQARKQFGLSRIEANDYATEVATLAVKSGDASRATDLLAGFLNIGAARGLSAAESLQKASKAILGVDEGTDALFGVNPSALWAEYATVIGKSASKFTEQEKAAALAYAVLDGGSKVVGSYAQFLNSAQGQQAALNSQLQEMKARLGEAMQPLRAFALDAMLSMVENSGKGTLAVGSLTHALVSFLGALKPIVAPILAIGTALVQVFGTGAEFTILQIRKLSGSTAVAVGMMIRHFGDLAERGGKFLRLLGIDIVAETGASLRKFGDDMVLHNARKLEIVEGDALAFKWRTEKIIGEWMGNTVDTVDEATTEVANTISKNAPRAGEAATAMASAISDPLGKPIQTTIELTQGALEQLAETARHQLPPKSAEEFAAHMKTLADEADEAGRRMDGLRTTTHEASSSTKATADDIQRVARAALDAAVAFGVIDQSAANTLNSVINIASGIAGVMSGDVTSGVAALLSGLTNVIASMLGGDAERNRLRRQNTQALTKLSKDIGGLRINLTGEDLLKAQSALGSVIGQLRGGRGAANERDVRNALYAQGLTMEDFDRIAKEFGIEVRTKSGALNVDSVKAVFEALGTVQLGKVGGGFQDQLDFFRESQDIGGEEGADRATNLLRFLQSQGRVGALGGLDFSDPAALREQLVALRAQLNSAAGIDESQLGALTGGQFNSLLVELIGLLGAPTGGGGSVSVSTGGAGGEALSLPTTSVQSVIAVMDAQVATLLTQHTPLHERIAVATEGSFERLISIDGKMDRLIDATIGVVDRADAGLADRLRLAQLGQAVR